MHSNSTLQILVNLLKIPSPSGFTEKATEFIQDYLQYLGIPYQKTRKGELVWFISGNNNDSGAKLVTLTAHIDTLGAMVKGLKWNGRLKLATIGGYDWATIEGANVKIHTQNGSRITGTIVNVRQSLHLYGSALRELKREQSTMEVRIDEKVFDASDLQRLGISVGDFVSFDSDPEVMPSGYIKARHLDNKAGVAILLAITEKLLKNPPKCNVAFHISRYEEVGHGGASGIPSQTDELIVLDMAVVGEGQNSTEHHVTLCLADSSGPYDHQLSNRLRQAAWHADIDLKLDLYPYYSSDGSAAWRGGYDFPVALIGPGIDASHAYERTHVDSLKATQALVLSYLSQDKEQ